MLLSRHPYAEKSGRGFMLRQRIAQCRARFDVRLVVMGHRAGDASDEGILFLGLAPKKSMLINAFRLARRPLQTWFYYSASARDRIAEIVRETGADAVYVDMLRLAPLVHDLPRNVALIVDYDDLLSMRYRRADKQGYDVLGFLAKRFGPLAGLARAFAAPLLAVEARRCDAYEREMMQRADVALFTSPREAQAMVKKGPALTLAIPPTLKPHALTVAAPGERLIFLGNMHYAENIAMLRSLSNAAYALQSENVWPADAVIEVAGDYAPDLPLRFPAAPIRFLGRIDDLAALAGAGVFLAPATSGSGVKLKVLDGMALGCPVAATPKALEGLSARANRDLLVAPDPKTMLAAALKLRTRVRLKAKFARRAHAYLERAHAPALGVAVWDAIEAAVARAKAR